MFSENINYSKWRVAYTNYFSFICSNINRVAIVIGRFLLLSADSYFYRPVSYFYQPVSYFYRPVSYFYRPIPTSIGRFPTSIGRFPTSIGRFPTSIGRFPTSIGRFLFVIFISYSKKDLCNRTGLGIIARWHLPTPDGQ
ncbi:hypothetical protein ACFPT3_08190 [Ectobacillus antri]|uniref:hypothetical protein n=1 Tax=Ectobacillus antri TaxID=2486280 RepID=UPI00362379F6